MKQSHRIIALVLVLVMVFTMLQSSFAFAADDPESKPPEGAAQPAETVPTDPTEPTDPEQPEEPDDPVLEHVVLSGTVLDEYGQSIPSFLVTIESKESVTDGEADWSHQEFTFSDGIFEIAVPKAHSYILSISAGDDYEVYREEIAAQEDIAMTGIVLNYAKVSISVDLVYATASFIITDIDGVETTYSADESTSIVVRKQSKVEWTASAKDGCILSESFVIDGVVCQHTDGTYVILSCDKDTEIAIQAIDTTAPTIIGIDVSDAETWTKSKTVTVSVTDNCDDESGIMVYISKSLFDNADAVKQSAAQLPDWKDVVTEEGTYYVYALDSACNMSTETFSVDHIDRDAPVISDLEADTLEWSTTVNYSFHAEDNVELSRIVWSSGDGQETELPISEDGNYQFTVYKNGDVSVVVEDIAGNQASKTAKTENIDDLPPEVTDVVVQEKWDLEKNLVIITVSDNAGIASVFITDSEGNETFLAQTEEEGKYQFVATENGEYTVTVTDIVGNETKADFTVNRIDNEQPVITSITKTPDSEWTNQAVDIEIQPTDTLSGVKAVYILNADILPEDFIAEEWTEITADEDGRYIYHIDNDFCKELKFFVLCVDNLDQRSEISALEVKIDVTAPVITEPQTDADTWSQEVTYRFRASDNSELKSLTYTTPNGEKTEYEINEERDYEFTAIENGEYIIEAVDMAGNTTTKTVTVLNVDRTAPQIDSVKPQTEWDAEKNTVSVQATDNAEMQRVYVVDALGNEVDLMQDENGLYQFLARANGEYTVMAVDVAGNSAFQQFVVDHIDTEQPAIAHIEKDPDVQWTTHEVKVTISPADTQSGVKAVYASAESTVAPTDDLSKWTVVQMDESGKYVFTVPNDKDSLDTYNFIVEDNVGRLSSIETFVIGIDVTAPVNVEVEFAKDSLSGFFKELVSYTPFALLYRDVVTVRAAAEDPSCGVNRYEYQVVKEGATLSDSGWKPMKLTREGDTSSAFTLIQDDDFIAEIYVRVYDNLGNCTQAITYTKDGKTVLCVLENTPDEYDERAEAPTLTARTESPDAAYEEGKWTNSNVQVHAESKGAISGIKKYQYQIVPVGQTLNENGWIDLEPSRRESMKADIRLTEDTNVDVYMRTVSHAENASKYSRLRVRIQKTPPENAAVNISGTIGTNNWYTSYPTIAITQPTVSDKAAPVTTYYDLHRRGAGSDTHPYGANKPAITSDGIYELVIWTVDEAGNKCTNSYSKTIYVDTTAPTDLALNIGARSILAEKPGSSKFNLIYNSGVTVMAGANCNISGLAALTYQKVYNNAAYKENGAWAPWPANGLVIQPNENCVVYLKAVDNAGNTTIVHSDGIIVDNTAPQGDGKNELSLMVVGANADGYFPGDASVDVSIIDPVVNNAMSGLKEISYKVVTDGVTTQNETIPVADNGEYIQRTGANAGNNGYISAWKGRITIKAAMNNSDNIVVTVTAVDQAGNARTTATSLGAIKIDTTAPTAVLSYDNNTADTEHDGAYFNADRTLTIRVTERDFEARLGNLRVTRNGEEYPVSLQWTKTPGVSTNGDDNVYTASTTFHEDGAYKVIFDAYDYAGNHAASIVFAEGTLAGDSFVIDQTSPIISVAYDNNNVMNGSFFDAKRIATITVKDVNFTEDRFICNVTAAKDGTPLQAPKLSAWTHNGDLHTATVIYADDGDYTFSASVTDKAGNKSNDTNYGASEAPESFTVDTTPVEVTVDGLEKNTAYAGSLRPTITFEDINFLEYTITLTRTNMAIKDQDVTEEMVKREDGKLLLNFDGEENNDGIYILKYSFTDKAGHVTADSYKFTVNRNGSVYEYSQDLLDLINQYVRTADGVYTITEYNPSPVTKSSLIITCDGDPNATVIWETEVVNENGANWYQYVHTIDPNNYLRDGKYRTTLSSEDGADNKTENTNSGKPEIIFWVDTTAPEVTSVTGMEEDIVNASKQDVTMSFYDTIGMASIKVFVSENGEAEKLVYEKASFDEAEETSFQTSIVLEEGLRQHVRIEVTDKAGNVTDTDVDGLNAAISFVKEITVSENFFVRWYANPWVFFGSISGLLVLCAGSIGGIIILKKKKKKDDVNTGAEQISTAENKENS